MRSPVISWTLILRERVTVKSQVSLLDLTLEASIPDDVMWPFMDGNYIVPVPHHDGSLVDRVDDGLDEEIDGMADDFARTTTGLLTPHKHTGPAVKVREISSYCKST